MIGQCGRGGREAIAPHCCRWHGFGIELALIWALIWALHWAWHWALGLAMGAGYDVDADLGGQSYITGE